MKTLIITLIFFLCSQKFVAQLYDDAVEVNSFNPTTFNATFESGTNETWLFQFYHSHCGHCINFSPIYKSFMKEAQYWSKIIRFGVVDCSADRSICTSLKIMGYPSFMIYQHNWTDLYIGHNSLDTFINNVVLIIDSRVNTTEFNEYNQKENKLQKYALVSGKNYLDLKRTILTFNGRLTMPLLFKVDIKDKGFTLMIFDEKKVATDRVPDLTALYLLLTKHIDKEANSSSQLHSTLIKPADSIPTDSSFARNSSSTTTMAPSNESSLIMSGVYNQDIYSSVWYALASEIIDAQLGTEPQLLNLTNFVDMMYQYSNISPEVTDGFERLRNGLYRRLFFLRMNKKFLPSWTNIIKQSKLPSIEPSWVGCNGSKPYLRRYPCGLWTTFHSLTVGLYFRHQRGLANQNQSMVLMTSIQNFIYDFFSCRECAENFMKETKDACLRVKNPENLILYLWEVHNTVNRRISGAPSDDPAHPKHAFPSRRVCPQCWLVDESESVKWPVPRQWNQSAVLAYIIKTFSPLNRVALPPSLVILQLQQLTQDDTTRWLPTSITQFDISLCFVLSLTCSLFVIILFFRFLTHSLTFRRLFCCYKRSPRYPV